MSDLWAVPALYSSRPLESAVAEIARDLASTSRFLTFCSGRFHSLPLTGSFASNTFNTSRPTKNRLSNICTALAALVCL